LKADSYAGNLVLDIIGYNRIDFVVIRQAAFATLEGI
jgi:hypothetical protein